MDLYHWICEISNIIEVENILEFSHGLPIWFFIHNNYFSFIPVFWWLLVVILFFGNLLLIWLKCNTKENQEIDDHKNYKIIAEYVCLSFILWSNVIILLFLLFLHFKEPFFELVRGFLDLILFERGGSIMVRLFHLICSIMMVNDFL